MALKDSTAKWKIVVGHHPIKSDGHHGNTQELVVQLLPILQVQYICFCLANINKNVKITCFSELNCSNFCKLSQIFQANNVDFYINGHDHCLEHISSQDR